MQLGDGDGHLLPHRLGAPDRRGLLADGRCLVECYRVTASGVRRLSQRCCYICATTAPFIPASPPRLRSRLPHVHRDWARLCHICIETGPTPPISAPGLGSPLPHLHRVRLCRLAVFTQVPTSEPSAGPTVVPTATPTAVPSAAPMAPLTTVPTQRSTTAPTAVRTNKPTVVPTHPAPG